MKKCDKCWGTGMYVDHYALGIVARTTRESRGESLKDAAKRMGISAGYLSYLEFGKRNWTQELYRKATR